MDVQGVLNETPNQCSKCWFCVGFRQTEKQICVGEMSTCRFCIGGNIVKKSTFVHKTSMSVSCQSHVSKLKIRHVSVKFWRHTSTFRTMPIVYTKRLSEPFCNQSSFVSIYEAIWFVLDNINLLTPNNSCIAVFAGGETNYLVFLDNSAFISSSIIAFQCGTCIAFV